MYKEIIVDTTQEGVDFVADAFFFMGAGGVKIIDPNDVNELIKSGVNWDYIDDKLLNQFDAPVKVSAFVSEEDCQGKIAALKEILKEISGVDFGTLDISVVDYVDGDWLTEWKKYYKPIDLGKFVVVPEWIDYSAKEGKIIIKIDPSMAFGTGEHESTKLCLQLLGEAEAQGKDVIDVGTGSGILGIGAAKAGAKSVYMCDIDSLSIKSARENAALNGVSNAVTIEESDLIKKEGLTGDVILANLTADILIRLSSGLDKHIRKNGIIICSGIIHSRKNEVIAAYQQKGYDVKEERMMGEWDALLFQKR